MCTIYACLADRFSLWLRAMLLDTRCVLRFKWTDIRLAVVIDRYEYLLCECSLVLLRFVFNSIDLSPLQLQTKPRMFSVVIETIECVSEERGSNSAMAKTHSNQT